MENQPGCQKIKDRLSDRKWRLNNLYHIRNKQGKKVLLNFNWAQESFFRQMWYFNVILKARQLGFSTFISIYFLDACLFNKNHKCGIIDAGIDDAKKKLKMIKFAYDGLPEWLREAVPMTTRAAELVEFENGSSISVGTSHRGDTLQKLLVSEYGKVSAKTPEKAREIKTGALNAVESGEQVFVESTAEGKAGEFYELCQLARKLKDARRKLSIMEPKFHFYAWYDNPDYRIDSDVVISKDVCEYLDTLPSTITKGQRAWYAIKEQTMGDEMRREFPSTPDEAFEGSAEGAYYTKEMALVRKNGQITNVPYDRKHPVRTFWDIGQGADQMTIWFYQMIKNQHRFINYHESSNEGWDFYANLLKAYGYVYEAHHWPHDGNKRIIGKEVRTSKQLAEQVGISPITITPRTKNVWYDIRDHCKPVLPNCWFDEKNCALGIARLDSYKRRWDRINAMWLNDAQHDEACHGADGFRTFAVLAEKIAGKKAVQKTITPMPSAASWMGG